MKTKKTNLKEELTVKEKVIAKVRETKEPTWGHNRTTKYYAWIQNDEIRIQEFANDSETDMMYNDYCIAL